MGIFDFLKKSAATKKITFSDSETKTLEQKNKDYLEFRQLEISRLNAAYNFDTIEGIRSIPVPCQEVNGIDSPTGRVEYYLRGKRFFDYWNAGETELALACLRKAQELMYVSDMIWKKEDFMRLVSYLHKAGFHGEANAEKERIDRFFAGEFERVKQSQFKDAINSAKFLGTDLLSAETSGLCCSNCARMRNRVYSISGKDRRFPKVNESVITSCCLRLYPYVLGVSELSFPVKNIVKYSNRPYLDDRSPEEVEKYNEWQEYMQEEEKRKHRASINQAEFFWIQEHLPSICPKSLSGYSRMKNSNSKTFQEIVKCANDAGYKIRGFDY